MSDSVLGFCYCAGVCCSGARFCAGSDLGGAFFCFLSLIGLVFIDRLNDTPSPLYGPVSIGLCIEIFARTRVISCSLVAYFVPQPYSQSRSIVHVNQ